MRNRLFISILSIIFLLFCGNNCQNPNTNELDDLTFYIVGEKRNNAHLFFLTLKNLYDKYEYQLDNTNNAYKYLSYFINNFCFHFVGDNKEYNQFIHNISNQNNYYVWNEKISMGQFAHSNDNNIILLEGKDIYEVPSDSDFQEQFFIYDIKKSNIIGEIVEGEFSNYSKELIPDNTYAYYLDVQENFPEMFNPNSHQLLKFRPTVFDIKSKSIHIIDSFISTDYYANDTTFHVFHKVNWLDRTNLILLYYKNIGNDNIEYHLVKFNCINQKKMNIKKFVLKTHNAFFNRFYYYNDILYFIEGNIIYKLDKMNNREIVFQDSSYFRFNDFIIQ